MTSTGIQLSLVSGLVTAPFFAGEVSSAYPFVGIGVQTPGIVANDAASPFTAFGTVSRSRWHRTARSCFEQAARQRRYKGHRLPPRETPSASPADDLFSGALFLCDRPFAQIASDGSRVSTTGPRVLFAPPDGDKLARRSGPGAVEPSKLAELIAEGVRTEAIVALRGHRHRISPTAGAYLLNQKEIQLVFDLSTGRLLKEGEQPPRDVVAIKFKILPDANRIEIDPVTAEGIRATFGATENPVHRAVLSGLMSIVEDPVLIKIDEPLLLEAPKKLGPEIVGKAHEGILQANLSFLRPNKSNWRITICFGPHTMNQLSFRVGTVSIDSKGRIVGSNLRMPLDASPRGTEYHEGAAGRGTQVVAVVLYNGALVWWVTGRQPLNAEQESAMRALYKAGDSARMDMQRYAPGVINQVLAREGFPTVPDEELPQVRPSIQYIIGRYGDTRELREYSYVAGMASIFGYRQSDEEVARSLTRVFEEFYAVVIDRKRRLPSTEDLLKIAREMLGAPVVPAVITNIPGAATVDLTWPEEDMTPVRALRQIVGIIISARSHGYSVELDERKFETAKKALGLGTQFEGVDEYVIEQKRIVGTDKTAPPIILLALSGEDLRTDYYFEKTARITVGRSFGETIQVLDAYLSKRNFTIEWDGQNWVVRDEGGTNRIYVNAEKVPSAVIGDMTSIEVGGTQFLVRIPVVAERVAVPPPLPPEVASFRQTQAFPRGAAVRGRPSPDSGGAVVEEPQADTPSAPRGTQAIPRARRLTDTTQFSPPPPPQGRRPDIVLIDLGDDS